MSKADLILAQKTFAANKLKWELKQQKTKGGDTTGDGGGSSLARSKSLPQFDSMKMSQGSGSEQQQQQQQQMFSPVKHGVGSTFGGDAEGKHGDDEVAVGLRKINVKELGTRGTTPATNLRKTNLTVSKSVLESKGNDPRLRTDPEGLFAELSRENYYLPKVTITRPDGATLMDIYRSKQADTWARILKAQIKEEEELKVTGKVPLEIHSHCMTGLAPLVYIEAVKLGVTQIQTSIAPLANGPAQPATQTLVEQECPG
jgi:hypothetical protein